jgi:hypothetical protein
MRCDRVVADNRELRIARSSFVLAYSSFVPKQMLTVSAFLIHCEQVEHASSFW